MRSKKEIYSIVRIVATLTAEYDLHVIPEDIFSGFKLSSCKFQ